MKLLNALGIICILTMAVKCGITDWDKRKSIRVKLLGEVYNHKNSFKIGDTIKFLVKVPDTVEVNDLNDNSISLVKVEQVKDVGLCAVFISFIDTVNKRELFGTTLTDDIIEMKSRFGKTPSGCWSFSKQSGNLYFSEIYFIPKVKGIYFFTLSNFNSNITINNTLRGITTVGINTPNKADNWNMIANALKFKQEVSVTLNEFQLTEDAGGGVYGFRVE